MASEKPTDKDPTGSTPILKELDVFAYEMFHFLLARRLCLWHKPLVIKPTESSEFIEEVGKSVLFKWFFLEPHLRQMLKDDFPKYVNTREAFMKYAMMRSTEIFDDTGVCPLARLLGITAFMLEMSCYCFEMGHLQFKDVVHECWKEVFLFLCLDSFVGMGGWPALHRKCIKDSAEYDKLGVETDVGSRFRKFDLTYFTPKDAASSGSTPRTCSKSVTLFATYDSTSNTKIPPAEDPADAKLPLRFQLDFG